MAASPLTAALTWIETVPPRVSIDPPTMRALALHEARAHAIGSGRVVEDLGDAILLHDPRDDDPFWNRLSALRLPEDAEAFGRRLEQLVGRFAELGRQPHVWASPLHDTPGDLPARLAARGFADLGHGLTMVLGDPARALAAAGVPARVTLERHRLPPAADRERLAYESAALLVAAFGVDPLARFRLAADMEASLDAPELTLYVCRVGETVVAAAKRTTFDDLSYLSSIGTHPAWQGRGLATAVTVAAVEDGLAEGASLTYLGVFADNVRARALYERLGFATVGGTAADFLLP